MAQRHHVKLRQTCNSKYVNENINVISQNPYNKYVLSDCLRVTQKIINQTFSNQIITCYASDKCTHTDAAIKSKKWIPSSSLHHNNILPSKKCEKTFPPSTDHNLSLKILGQKRPAPSLKKRILKIKIPIPIDDSSSVKNNQLSPRQTEDQWFLHHEQKIVTTSESLPTPSSSRTASPRQSFSRLASSRSPSPRQSSVRQHSSRSPLSRKRSSYPRQKYSSSPPPSNEPSSNEPSSRKSSSCSPTTSREPSSNPSSTLKPSLRSHSPRQPSLPSSHQASSRSPSSGEFPSLQNPSCSLYAPNPSRLLPSRQTSLAQPSSRQTSLAQPSSRQTSSPKLTPRSPQRAQGNQICSADTLNINSSTNEDSFTIRGSGIKCSDVRLGKHIQTKLLSKRKPLNESGSTSDTHDTEIFSQFSGFEAVSRRQKTIPMVEPPSSRTLSSSQSPPTDERFLNNQASSMAKTLPNDPSTSEATQKSSSEQAAARLTRKSPDDHDPPKLNLKSQNDQTNSTQTRKLYINNQTTPTMIQKSANGQATSVLNKKSHLDQATSPLTQTLSNGPASSANFRDDSMIVEKASSKPTFSKRWKTCLYSNTKFKVKEKIGEERSKTSTGHYPVRVVVPLSRSTKSAGPMRRPITDPLTSSVPPSNANNNNNSSHVLLDSACKGVSRRLEEIMYNDNLTKFRETMNFFTPPDRKKVVDFKENHKSPNIFFRACILNKMKFVAFILAECQPDLELTGPFLLQEDISEQIMVTPLWHAAATGNLVLLQMLKDVGANMDCCSDTGSTAILAACYMSHVEVAKYLLFNKVNVKSVNSKGLSCLMSAVHNVQLVRLLVLNGAEINRSDLRGNTAMHYAAEDGQLTAVQILHEMGGNALQPNNDGDNAIQTAAKHRRCEAMEFLLQTSSPLKIEHIIEVYELFAAMAILLDFEFETGYTYFHKAMSLRHMNKSQIIRKRSSQPSVVEASENIKEFSTLSELTALAEKNDDLTLHAMLVYERQMGCMHESYLELLLICGATFADRLNFKVAANMWKLCYSLNYNKCISSLDPFNQKLLKNVHSIVKLLYQWKREDCGQGKSPNEDDRCPIYYRILEPTMREIFILLCDHSLLAHTFMLKPSASIRNGNQNAYFLLLRSVLCVLLLYTESFSLSEGRDSFLKRLQPLLAPVIRGKSGQTLLHMSVLPDTLQHLGLDSFRRFMNWPSLAVLDILLLLGADPTSRDETGNTPIHLVAALNRHGSSTPTLSVILKRLLEKGAHPDQVNSSGHTAIDLVASGELKQCLQQHVSLKCLAARVITSCNIPYVYEVPSTLYSFVELHRNVVDDKSYDSHRDDASACLVD